MRDFYTNNSRWYDYDELCEHLDDIRPKNWQNKKGQPKKMMKVFEYRQSYPEASQYRCQKDTGLSINTVKKWWDWKPSEFK